MSRSHHAATASILNRADRSQKESAMVRRTRTVGNLVAFVSTLTLVLVTAGPGLGAPDGDGGGLLGILDLDTQTQIDDLFATEDPSILSSDPRSEERRVGKERRS